MLALITLLSVAVVIYYMTEIRNEKILNIKDYFPDNFYSLDNDEQRYIINQSRQENTNYWLGYAAKIWVVMFWVSVTIGMCLLLGIIMQKGIEIPSI
jgi:hypothetical protein